MHQQVNNFSILFFFLFFFNPRGESFPRSERTLGKLQLGSPAAPNISLHHYANAALVFPQSGEGPNPSFPQHPTAAYSLGSATIEDCSIRLHFSSGLALASFCLRVYLLQLCAGEPPSALVFKCNETLIAENTQLQLLTFKKDGESKISIIMLYLNAYM